MRSAFSLQVSATVVLCHVRLMSGVLSFGSQRTNALQWIVQLCSDKCSLPLYPFPGLRRERRDKMHCAQSEHPYSYMYAECS